MTVSTEDVGDAEAVRFRVKDDGKGISREIQTSIFEPFFTTKEEVQGVGLGLSVVYGIVTAHGGNIELKSEPGKGAAFIITLPRRGKPRKEMENAIEISAS